MRPIGTEQNSLRYPLNELFGTEAHVRLLRVLANEEDGPLTVSDVAERSGLTLPGAKKALWRLYQSGFVLRVGGGKKHQYEIRRANKLVKIALELFQVEKDRYDKILNTIKIKIQNLEPYPHSVWIQTFPNKQVDALELGVLHDTRHITNYMRNLRKQLNQVEQKFDLTIEVTGNAKADIPFLDDKSIKLLYGVPPIPDSMGPQLNTGPQKHEIKDRWLVNLSQKIAEAIERDSSLIRRAKDHLDRLLQTERGLATSAIKEWRDILETYSIPRLSRFITSTSERANRLRQSNPLFAVLSPDEKDRLMRSWENDSDT
jgi:predicted transcriptional regulator